MRRLLAVMLLMFTAPSVLAVKEVYRVGVEDLSYYPLMNFGEVENTSILQRIMMEFAASEDVTFEFIPLPIHRFNAWYDEGAIDFRLPDNPSWTSDNDPKLSYSDPVVTLCANVVTLAENRDMATEEFDRIGTLYGFLPDMKWHDGIAAGDIEVVTDSSLRVLTRMLMNGMVDGLDLHISAIEHQADELGEPRATFSVASSFAKTTLGYRLSTRQHSDLLDRFNRFLANEHAEVRRIIDTFSFREGCNG